MARIAIITNENKLVERKTSFFADYFGFYAEKVGRFYETEPENPLSLTEKIIFQLTSNPHIKKGNYVHNYFEHHYFREDTFLKQFKKYPAVKAEILVFKAIVGRNENDLHTKRGKWLQNNTTLLPALEELKKELDESMIRRAFDELVVFLLCNHPLETHQESIIYITQVLVSEAYFKGRSKSQILNVFFRLLSKDIEKFPFSKDLVTDQQKREYLQQRDFKKQFEGIVNFINEPPTRRFLILKASGLSMEKDYDFSYNVVRFLGVDHTQLETIKKKMWALDKENAAFFFEPSNHMLAVMPVDSFEDELIISQFLKPFRDAAAFLGLSMDRNVVINAESYMITSDFDEVYWKLAIPREAGKRDTNQLSDTPYIFLNNYVGPSTTHILRQEATIITAFKNDDIEGYWKYFENLFAGKGAKTIIETIATILLLNEKSERNHNVTDYLFGSTLPWNFDYKRFGMTPSQFISIRNKLGDKKTIYFLNNFDYPFFQELKKIHGKKHTKKRFQKMYDYYHSLLLELYESRNSVTHSNLLHPKAHIKLELTIPRIVSRLRWLIFKYIRKNQNLPFESLTELIVRDAEKLL
ncbi:hypothetical protein [Ferruginibacter sp.]